MVSEILLTLLCYFGYFIFLKSLNFCISLNTRLRIALRAADTLVKIRPYRKLIQRLENWKYTFEQQWVGSHLARLPIFIPLWPQDTEQFKNHFRLSDMLPLSLKKTINRTYKSESFSSWLISPEHPTILGWLYVPEL